MEMTKRQQGDVTIFDFAGSIVFDGTDLGIRKAILDELEGGARKLLINLSGVDIIDSAGTGQLVAAFAAAANKGGALKFAAVPPKVAYIMKITQLNTLFEIHDDEAAALASFGATG